jgi:hypothetical protein
MQTVDPFWRPTLTCMMHRSHGFNARQAYANRLPAYRIALESDALAAIEHAGWDCL